MRRYCGGCRAMIREDCIKEGVCQLCGKKLKPHEAVTLPPIKKHGPKLYDIMVEYIDTNTGQVGTVTYTDVTEEMFNKIKYRANNVLSVHQLTRQ